jgi:hypothetical protein
MSTSIEDVAPDERTTAETRGKRRLGNPDNEPAG